MFVSEEVEVAQIVDPEGRETEALRAMADFRGKDVIDIGCGEGRTTRGIARTGARVLGVDPNEDVIARALDRAEEEQSMPSSR